MNALKRLEVEWRVMITICTRSQNILRYHSLLESSRFKGIVIIIKVYIYILLSSLLCLNRFKSREANCSQRFANGRNVYVTVLLAVKDEMRMPSLSARSDTHTPNLTDHNMMQLRAYRGL